MMYKVTGKQSQKGEDDYTTTIYVIATNLPELTAKLEKWQEEKRASGEKKFQFIPYNTYRYFEEVIV